MALRYAADWAARMKWIALALAVGLGASGSARAETGTCLEWDVPTDTGRLSVRRAQGESVWRGETLAEIVYWDATGAEHSEPLNAASGWQMERRPAEHGCRLVCRQETLGFSITLDFAAADDVLTVGVPAGDVVESGPARLKTLRLLPRFGAASEGDAGYLVIAQQSGALCHFRDRQPGQHWVSVYQSSCQCPMPLFGVVRGNRAVAGIITSGQFDARFGISVNWGPQHQYAIDPAFTLRSFRDEPRLPEDLTVEYCFGQCVVINYGEQPHTLPSGEIVPARDYLLIGSPNK